MNDGTKKLPTAIPFKSVSKKIPPEELNDILLHVTPNTWAKQAYIKSWDSEGRTYKDTCKNFECMEIAEQV